MINSHLVVRIDVSRLQRHKNQKLANILKFLPIMTANIVLIYSV